MKKRFYIISIFLTLFFTSCEDVVRVDLDTAAPRLVIEASVNWEKGTNGNEQRIKLSTTTGYYNPVIPAVSGAVVSIENEEGTVFEFIESPGTGEYTCFDFVPEWNQVYTLTVQYNGQTYTANESFKAAPDITEIEQINDGGFFGDEIEIKIYYQDFIDESNFYLFRIDSDILAFPTYINVTDDFYQNNMMSTRFIHEDLEPGKIVDIKLYGISETYYNFMERLLEAGEGSPFQSPTGTIRGNIINQTNENNFALGFFRLSEFVKASYTVE